MLRSATPDTKEAVEAGKNGALLIAGPEGPAFAALPAKPQRLRMTLPVWLLCELRGARATLTLFDDEAGTDGVCRPVPFDFDAFAGAKPLFDEACPPSLSTRR
jgi:hypothetical protein